MHRRARQPHRRVRAAAILSTALLVAMAATLLLAGVQVRSGRWQVAPVLSGSMRPGFAVGGVVIAQRVPVSQLHVRDVVVMRRPDNPDERVVHRIVSLQPGRTGPVIQTQGDANPVRDPWRVSLRDDSAYRVRWSVPLVGYPALYLHRPDTRRHVMMLAGLLLLVAATVVVAPRRRRVEPADSTASTPGDEPRTDPGDEPGRLIPDEPLAPVSDDIPGEVPPDVRPVG